MRSRRPATEPAATRAAVAKPAPQRREPGETLKIPMPDQVNEIVILAAALVDLNARKQLVGMIPADSFYAPGHPEAWTVIIELERRGLAYDPATVLQLSNGKVDTNYLDMLVRDRPAAPPNLTHHVDELRWGRTCVEAIRGPLQGLHEELRDPLREPEKVRAYARQLLVAFDGYGSQKYLRDPGQLRRSAMARVHERRTGQAVYPFGLPGLDMYGSDDSEPGQWRMVPGAAPKHVSVITGVPGSGKTTVISSIALAQANSGRRVLFGAWEQGSEGTLELMACQSLGFSRTALATGQFDDGHERELEAEMERLEQHIRFFDLPFDRARGEKRSRDQNPNDKNLDLIHEHIATSGAQVAVFDLFRRALRDFDPDEEEHALYRAQAIAQETGCHLVLVHQLRAKDLEGRIDKRPTREALKGSSAWFEVPDTILGVHREFLFKDVPDDRLQVIVLKQRHGVFPLAVEFDWDADRGVVTNGRSITYERAGQLGMGAGGIDDFIAGGASSGLGGSNGTGRGKGRGKRGK